MINYTLEYENHIQVLEHFNAQLTVSQQEVIIKRHELVEADDKVRKCLNELDAEDEHFLALGV